MRALSRQVGYRFDATEMWRRETAGDAKRCAKSRKRSVRRFKTPSVFHPILILPASVRRFAPSRSQLHEETTTRRERSSHGRGSLRRDEGKYGPPSWVKFSEVTRTIAVDGMMRLESMSRRESTW